VGERILPEIKDVYAKMAIVTSASWCHLPTAAWAYNVSADMDEAIKRERQNRDA
jgi:hypothetical protein